MRTFRFRTVLSALGGRAFLHDVIQRRPRTWDKTVRVEATAIPE